MMIRIGLVGLGDQWESRHSKALHALSDRFKVTAVCCEVFARGEQVAKEFDAAAIHSFRSLIHAKTSTRSCTCLLYTSDAADE